MIIINYVICKESRISRTSIIYIEKVMLSFSFHFMLLIYYELSMYLYFVNFFCSQLDISDISSHDGKLESTPNPHSPWESSYRY